MRKKIRHRPNSRRFFLSFQSMKEREQQEIDRMKNRSKRPTRVERPSRSPFFEKRGVSSRLPRRPEVRPRFANPIGWARRNLAWSRSGRIDWNARCSRIEATSRRTMTTPEGGSVTRLIHEFRGGDALGVRGPLAALFRPPRRDGHEAGQHRRARTRRSRRSTASIAAPGGATSPTWTTGTTSGSSS